MSAHRGRPGGVYFTDILMQRIMRFSKDLADDIT